MKYRQQILVIFILSTLFFSCSDAEIVSGTFHGKMYAMDTLDADVKVTAINDGYVRLDLTSTSMSGGYVEYAQLTKNGELAYNLKLINSLTDSIELAGYYFEGFLSFDSWNHQYKFTGNKQE